MTNRPFPVSPALSAIAIAYQNRSIDMLYKKALPPVQVFSERFTWLNYPIAERLSVIDAEVGRKGRVSEMSFTAEEKDGRIHDYGLDDVIPISDLQEAERQRQERRSRFSPEAHAVESLTSILELGREVRAAKIVQDPNNYDPDRRLSLIGTSKISDFESSDPYEILNDGMTKPLVYRANTVSMGQSVWEVLKRHPRLIKAAKGGLTEDGAITRQQLADLLEIEVSRLLIGVSILNTAPKGQPVTLSKVWGNSIQMSYIDFEKMTATDNVLTWGFTAELESRVAGSYDDPLVGLQGAKRVRVGERVSETVCAKSLGYIIQNVI